MQDHRTSSTHRGAFALAAVSALTIAIAGCATPPPPTPPDTPPPAVAPEPPAQELGVIRTCNAAKPPGTEGVGGVVEMSFQVGIEGEPFNIAVVAAEPAGVFDAVAMEALACWRFQPELDTSVVRRVIIEFVP